MLGPAIAVVEVLETTGLVVCVATAVVVVCVPACDSLGVEVRLSPPSLGAFAGAAALGTTGS